VAKLSISGDSKNSFQTGDIVKFRIQSDMFGTNISPLITFRVPNIPPSINKANVEYTKNDFFKTVEGVQWTYVGVPKYRVDSTKNKNLRRLTIQLPIAFSATDLKSVIKGTKVKLDIGSHISVAGILVLDNVEITVDTKSGTNKTLSFLINKNNYNITITSGWTSTTIPSNDLVIYKEYSSADKIAMTRYTVSVKNDYNKYLSYNSYVHDFIVTYYQKPEEVATTLVSSTYPFDPKNPPPHQHMLDNFLFKGKPVSNKSIQFKKTDIPAEGIKFFVAVARYIYNEQNSAWEGYWIHIDENKEVVVGPARFA